MAKKQEPLSVLHLSNFPQSVDIYHFVFPVFEDSFVFPFKFMIN
jgi:hypothetical protein